MSKHSRKSKRGFKPRGAYGIPRYKRSSIPKIDSQHNAPQINKFKLFWLLLKFRVYNFIMKLKRRFK